MLDDFLSWCDNAFLQLNVSKTKELCIDFRLSPQSPRKSLANGETVDIVKNYKYLGTIIDDKLKFDLNTDMMYKKGQQRLYCLRKLAKFSIDKTLMKLFYCAYIETVISFSIICWYGNLCVKDKNSLGKIVKVASKIIGTNMSSLGLLFNKQVLNKAMSIRADAAHPLNAEYRLLPSGRRFETPSATTNRHKFSFVPISIGSLNLEMKKPRRR